MRIRQAVPEDASAIIALFEGLYAETKFLILEPGESVAAVEQFAERIARAATAGSELWFVAEVETQLVGLCYGRRGFARRNRHSLYLVIGVLRAWSGRGVGRALLKEMEQWAVSGSIHRLELTVNVMNTRAIALYEKVGFEREGTKRHSVLIDGEYADELYMAKLLAN